MADLFSGHVVQAIVVIQMHALHAGMEDQQFSVFAHGNVGLDHVGALFQRDLVGGYGVAGNVAAAGTAVSHHQNVLLGRFENVKAHGRYPFQKGFNIFIALRAITRTARKVTSELLLGILLLL